MTPLSLVYHDVNQAYSEIQTIKGHYVQREETRNGPALSFPMPVIVEHTTPYRRVLFDPARDANPFFHYMEAIWMLAGEKNVSFPGKFAKNIFNYSDDGVVLHGAYGHRWRYHFDMDQVEQVIHMLTKDPATRRAVIAMWDPIHDLGSDTKDLPCNTHLFFRIVDGKLNMTVCNRSNDLCWGMLGANIVHFSVLQEYIASDIDVPLGSLYQFTNNLHIYEGWEDKYTYHEVTWYSQNPSLRRYPFGSMNFSVAEAAEFCELQLEKEYACKILRDNAVPMLATWNAYKNGDLNLALHLASKIYDDDWCEACTNWLKRRLDGPKSATA